MSKPIRWAVPLAYYELMTLDLAAIEALSAAGPREVETVADDEFAARPALVDLWRATAATRTDERTGLIITAQKIAEPFPDRVEAGSGRRHAALLSMAGTLRRRGLELGVIIPMLLGFNEQKLEPPAPEADVRRIAESVMGYESAGVPFDDQLWTRMVQGAPSGGSKTELPTSRGAVGSEVLEAGGDELAASEAGAAPLPYLPVLGTDGLAVEGWSHLVAGYPRVGKTELAVACCRDWLDGGRRVLYLTEEPRSIWEQRLHGLEGDWSGLRVVFGLGADPDALRGRARRGAEDVVVLDALRNLLQVVDEKDNSEIARRVNPWVADCRATDKTFVALHHERKGGGSYGEGVAGGHALMGCFDVVVELLRDPHGGENRRLLRSYARLIQGREVLYERGADGEFALLGDPQAVDLEEVKERLLAVMPEEPTKTSDLLALLDDPRPSAEQGRRALAALAHAGVIRRDPPIEQGGKQQGKTHRWWREPDPTEGEEELRGDTPRNSGGKPNFQRPLLYVGSEVRGPRDAPDDPDDDLVKPRPEELATEPMPNDALPIGELVWILTPMGDRMSRRPEPIVSMQVINGRCWYEVARYDVLVPEERIAVLEDHDEVPP